MDLVSLWSLASQSNLCHSVIEMNVFYSAIRVATRGRVSCSAGLMISGRVGGP